MRERRKPATTPIWPALVLVVLGVALLSGSLSASKLVGPGVSSCGTWTADRLYNPRSARLDEAWVLGFMSGIGYSGIGDPLNGLDYEGVAAWIDNYCQTHPIANIADAATALFHAHPR